MRKETYQTRLQTTTRSGLCAGCGERYAEGTVVVYKPAEQHDLAGMGEKYCPVCSVCQCGTKLTESTQLIKIVAKAPQCYKCYYGSWVKEDATKEF